MFLLCYRVFKILLKLFRNVVRLHQTFLLKIVITFIKLITFLSNNFSESKVIEFYVHK